MKLLHIDSSILGDNSASRAVSREIVARWQKAVPHLQVEHLDLVANELPHLTGHHLAQMQVAESRDAQILADFMAADVVVIGAPMYNFGISTQLKSWIDRVVVAGKTFKYGPNGPEGLVHGKRVIIAISRGGVYPDQAPAEHAESYLKIIFGFIGVTDLTFVRAEGLMLSPEHRQKGLNAALAAIPATQAA
ncbi:MAG TPA: NAD(P)H-dependent oxidoreductase [Steroidobacteraceae bacterium]|jgi:FMN-dependent NADH-azoreductase|nr:NAD(P)H-dependent oxidoreductase [Steroidobacteraceae bacterium]